MKKIILVIGGFIVIIGVVALAFSKILGINFVYLEWNGTYNLWTYNFSQYLQDLGTRLNQITEAELLTIPTIAPIDWSDLTSSLKTIANQFLTGINFIIFTLNAMFVIFKLVIYVIIIFMAIIGINSSDYRLYNTLMGIYEAQIPYIPYLT